MTYSEYTSRRREYEQTINSATAMLQAVDSASEEDCPPERKAVYYAQFGAQRYQAETALAELIHDYIGTVSTFYGRHSS